MSKFIISDKPLFKEYKGEIEFIFKDRSGKVVKVQKEPNIVKIFAKEILAHRMFHSKIWEPTADGGAGAWIQNPVDPLEEFSAKYILLGASFDENNVPLDINDARYYTTDPVSGDTIPISLEAGELTTGGLINSIPLSEPDRPLKRIEAISFEPSYQPTGTPQLQNDVRAVNNIVLLQTTLEADEYNGFTGTAGDAYTITEIALSGGKEFNAIGNCECGPEKLFLEGNGTEPSDEHIALTATANGTDVITLDPTATSFTDLIKEGDQVKLVANGSNRDGTDILSQTSPYYLVLSKAVGGNDIQLDRVPSDSSQNPIIGQVGVFRNSLRIFSHRILAAPVRKSKEFEITIIWRIIFN